MENISVEVLASVLGTDPGVLVESLKTAGGDPKVIIGDLISKKNAVDRKSIYDEGHGRGKREALTTIEKDLAKKHEISEYQGIEGLIDGILQKHTKTNQMNPDDVRKSEIYLNDLKAHKDEVMKAKAEFKSFKEQIEHEQVRSVVNNAATSIIENPENKYIIPQNAEIKNNLVKTFHESLWRDGTKFDIKDGKIIGVLGKDDQVVRDENYVALTYDQYVNKVARGYFEVAKSDDRSGTGAGTQPPAGGGSNGSFNFPDREAFFTAYLKEADPGKKESMKKYESEQLQKGVW